MKQKTIIEKKEKKQLMKDRDLFAGLAMQELLRSNIENNIDINFVALSEKAYLIADEMVKVGDKVKLPEDIENIA